MTALDFTPEQAATLARIDAAPDAPESLRWRVAEALFRAQWTVGDSVSLADEPPAWIDLFLAEADAAIRIITEDARR